MLIYKFIGYALIHLFNLGVPSAHLLKTFNWLQVTFNWYMQGKQSPPEVCKVLNSFNWYHYQFLIILELPPSMILSKYSWFKHLVVYLISILSFCAHTYGKLSSCHASFVILWSTVVNFQLVSSLISYNWIISHGTNSLGY